MPVFRSASLVGLLEQFYLAAGPLERSVSELARGAGVPYATAHRDVERLTDAGLVESRRVGSVRLVSLNRSHPGCEALGQLVALAAGPRYRIAEALDGIDADAVYLFGSWAARYLGERGDRPADIDVLIVGEVDPQRVFERLRPVEEMFQMPVNATVVPADQWAEPASAFLRSVKGGPLVVLASSGEVSRGDDRRT